MTRAIAAAAFLLTALAFDASQFKDFSSIGATSSTNQRGSTMTVNIDSLGNVYGQYGIRASGFGRQNSPVRSNERVSANECLADQPTRVATPNARWSRCGDHSAPERTPNPGAPSALRQSQPAGIATSLAADEDKIGFAQMITTAQLLTRVICASPQV